MKRGRAGLLAMAAVILVALLLLDPLHVDAPLPGAGDDPSPAEEAGRFESLPAPDSEPRTPHGTAGAEADAGGRETRPGSAGAPQPAGAAGRGPPAGETRGRGTIAGRAVVPVQLRDRLQAPALHVVRSGGADGGTEVSVVLAPFDASGRYVLRDLAPGRYRLQVVSSGEPVSEARTVELRPGGRVDAVDFDFRPEPSVRGVVLDASGVGIAAVTVRAGDAPPVHTESDGSFVLSGMEVGRHRIVFEHPDHAPSSRDVTVRGSTVETLPPVQLQTGAEAWVYARFSSGGPAADVLITVSNALHLVSGRTGPDGLVRLGGLTPGGRYEVRRPDASLDERDVVLELDPGATGAVELVLHEDRR